MTAVVGNCPRHPGQAMSNCPLCEIDKAKKEVHSTPKKEERMFTLEEMKDCFEAGKRREWAENCGRVPTQEPDFETYVTTLK